MLTWKLSDTLLPSRRSPKFKSFQMFLGVIRREEEVRNLTECLINHNYRLGKLK